MCLPNKFKPCMHVLADVNIMQLVLTLANFEAQPYHRL